MIQNLRIAARVLRRNPAFTAVAVCSLAIGIGANSAIFSVADALLLRPLPVPEPSNVVSVRMKSPSERSGNLSYPDYLDFRDRNHSFQNLVAYAPSGFGLAKNAVDVPKVKYGFYVSGNFFRALRVEPPLGRGFRDDEDRVAGRDAVAVLSHDLWLSEFAGNPSVIGQKLRLNGIDFIVIGVASARFTGVDQYFRPALFVPIAMSARLNNQEKLTDRGYRWLTAKGRLKPQESTMRAENDLAALARGLERAYPITNRDQAARVVSELKLRIEQDPPDSELVAMLMTLAAFVLLVACANVAGLQLSRARARMREIAIRLAIGANRRHLIGQLFLESLLLALLGGAAGILVAYLGTKFFGQARIPSDMPIVISAKLDTRALLFTLAVSITSTVLSGFSAFRSTKFDLVPALKTADADFAGRKRLRGRSVLVVGQIALSLMLLTVAALIYGGFTRQLAHGPGYRTSHMVLMSFDPSLLRYSPAQTEQFYRRLLEQARSETGVTSAALTSVVPLSPNQQDENIVPADYELPRNQPAVSIGASTASEGYFETVGITILRGRGFYAADSAKAPLVAVVNQQLADRYWPKQDVVGKRFHLDNATGPLFQIIGVAQTVKYAWIGEAPQPFLYLPLSQHPRMQMTLIVQSAIDSASLAPALRRAIHNLDANLPIYDVRTMESFYHDRAIKVPELIVQTIAVMGFMALALAIVGLYGLVAFSVSRRTREIGIRMAIGASRFDILRMVLKQSGKLAAVGIAVGILGSLGADRVVRSALDFTGTGTTSAVVILTVVVQLTATLIATYIPARRASLVDPKQALRDD